jgi:hypothetical protein
MTRTEETARVAELRAAFAADPEPDVWRWFARREDQQSAAEPARDRVDDAWSQIAGSDAVASLRNDPAIALDAIMTLTAEQARFALASLVTSEAVELPLLWRVMDMLKAGHE